MRRLEFILLWLVLFFAAMLLGMLLPHPALADHTIDECDLRTGTMYYSVHPDVDQAPWQLAQREINWAGEPRDIYLQRPWGQPSDIYILPGTALWVQEFDRCAWSIIWVPSWGPSIWAAHELLHTRGLGDHRYWWQRDDTRYSKPDVFCNGPYADPYEGIMSYCHLGMRWWADDQALLERIW